MATDKTVLDFTEITDSEDADILYAIRGTDDTRDKKTTKASFLAPDRLKGIATYDATFEYLADNSIVQYDNLIWRSIYGTTGTPNVGNTPGIANLDKWELVSVITTALNISATGSITQTIDDLFVTSDTSTSNNTITIPDGVRKGQKFNFLSTGSNDTILNGTGISSFTLNENENTEFIWLGTMWSNDLTVNNLTVTGQVSGDLDIQNNLDVGNDLIVTGQVSGDLDIQNNLDVGNDLIVTNNIEVTGGVTQNSVTLKTKVVEIGDWDMPGNTQKIVNVGSGVLNNVRSVTAIIRNDANTIRYPLNSYSVLYSNVAGGVDKLDYTVNNVHLVRTTGSTFDSTNYDSTSYNRGWIYIEYEV